MCVCVCVGVYSSFSHEFGFCARSTFFSNSPAHMHNSAQIDTPHSSRAHAPWRSFCRFTDLRTASVPAFQPAETFMTCLTQSGPTHPACWDIQVPTYHFWGCVGGFYKIMPLCRPPTGSKFTIVRVLLTFLDVCKFTTFLWPLWLEAIVGQSDFLSWPTLQYFLPQMCQLYSGVK